MQTSNAPQETGHARDPLESFLEPLLGSMGFDLLAIEWAGASQGGSRKVLRVFIDCVAGVSVGDCARMSPIIGNALDATEADPGHADCAPLLGAGYVLEVSSPGLARPLVRRSHFDRFLGRRAKVCLHPPLAVAGKQKIFHGYIRSTAVDPVFPTDDRAGYVELESLDGSGELTRLRLSDVRRANLVYEG
ncbi:MAG: ribosome maturation factor RimP [Nannocystaceae bacterium]